MTEQPLPDASPLVEALQELEALVEAQPVQPLHQLAEGQVLHWLRVVEDTEPVQPRLAIDGRAGGAFHHGMEPAAAHQLDPLPEEEVGFAPFPATLAERLEAMAGRLHEYFGRTGYRSSAEQCDGTMVHLARLSRFLSAWCLRAEEAEPPGPQALARPPHPAGSPAQARWAHFFWEPPLNDAIVAWEQNSLRAYEEALQHLLGLLESAEAERMAAFVGPGYPLRPLGHPRLKVTVYTPEQRPLRGRSIFAMRCRQLRQRLSEAGAPAAAVLTGLLEDVRHFLAMIRANRYLLASRPGFLTAQRPGLPLVRGHPGVHPFLLDRIDLFKQAILFHNGTYTREGGGLDRMYLRVRQLQRFCRFQQSAEARRIRGPADDAVIAWDENRWHGFTGALVGLAGLLRHEGEPPAE